MTKTTDNSPAPGFYNGDSQAIEAVRRIEAVKVEKRRAARHAPVSPEPATETETDRNRSGLPKAEIDRFTEAVERRAGRIAYVDWRVIGGVYWKACKVALEKSGQKSRRN